MSRRRAAIKREVIPDAKYGDIILAKFINNIMLQGKKSVAEKIVYGMFDRIDGKVDRRSALDIFHEAINKVKPDVEVRSRRIGGATYQIPVEVRDMRRQALSFRWLIESARKRSERTMVERLASEFLDAYQGRGGALKKREDTHKMAEANKAFAHYRW